MNQLLKSSKGLNPAGVGPRIFAASFPCLIAGFISGNWFPNYSQWTNSGEGLLMWVGLPILIIGFLIYITAMLQFLRRFKNGELITNGVYALSRNPIYASWVLFILPGLSLICNNWCFGAAALCMYLALVTKVKKEEVDLLSVFGDSYKAYQQKVGRVGFFPGLNLFK